MRFFETETKAMNDEELRRKLYEKLARQGQPAPDTSISVKDQMAAAGVGMFPQMHSPNPDVVAAAPQPEVMAQAKQKNAVAPPTEEVFVPSNLGTASPKEYGYGEDLNDAAIKAANKNRDRKQFATAIGSAMDGLVAGVAGSKADPEFFKQLNTQAGQESADILTRRKAAGEEIDFTNKQSLQDPASPDNAAFRQFIQTKMPALAKSRGFNELTLANPALTKIAEMWMKSEDRKIALEANRLKTEELKTAKQTQFEQGEARRREQLDFQMLQALQKSVPDQAASVTTVLNRLDKNIGGIGNLNSSKDVPGVGPVVNAYPIDIGLSKEGQEVRQDAKALARILIQLQSGLVATESEVKAKLEEMGMKPGSSEHSFRRGLQNAKEQIVSVLEKKEAGYPKHVREKYAAQGGTSADSVRSIGAAPVTKEDPRIQQARDAGYSEEEIQAFLNGKK